MIIGIVGFIGSGKDTIADYLVEKLDFKRDSFAGTLKDAVAAIFGWDRDLVDGRTKEARIWREQVDPWWAERLNMPNLTPRLVLQLWGTEVGRQAFHTDIWIASLENKLRKSKGDIVITDCRFPNEVQAIKNAGGIVIWVQRGELPDWYGTAFLANSGDTEMQTKLKSLGIHASETSWIGESFDDIIANDGTLTDLYSKVRDLVLGPPAANEPLLYAELSDSSHI